MPAPFGSSRGAQHARAPSRSDKRCRPDSVPEQRNASACMVPWSGLAAAVRDTSIQGSTVDSGGSLSSSVGQLIGSSPPATVGRTCSARMSVGL